MNIGFIGFGEAAIAFARGLQVQIPNIPIAGYDVKIGGAANEVDIKLSTSMRLEFSSNNVICCETARDLAEFAQVIFCLVTPDQALEAATSAAGSLREGTYYFDGNSCAPVTKQKCEQVIEAVGARYVDMAIMAPVVPKLHKTPLLLSGRNINEAATLLAKLGMVATVQPGKAGQASSVKMIRSVMVKGLEALTAECMLSAYAAGVEEAVLDSLDASFSQQKFSTRSSYNLERMMVHGVRRAAEMHEVAATLTDLGVVSDMSRATANWQKRIGDLTLKAGLDDYRARLDMILSNLDMVKMDESAKDE